MKSSGLKLGAATIATMNPVIFKTQVIGSLPGLTKDGDKYFKLDTVNNTATEVTADNITEGAKKALESGKDKDGYLKIAENFGLVREVSLVSDGNKTVEASWLPAYINVELGMKVTDVTVDVQNDIIFKTTGINEICGLTQDGSNYYDLDTKNNTATLVNPEIVAEKATKDILKGEITDYVQLATGFSLISAITFKVAQD
jgi:hypothetical protein